MRAYFQGRFSHSLRRIPRSWPTSSPPSPSPKGTRTRSPTRSPTPSSTPSSPKTPRAACAIETLCTTGLVVVAGEVTTETYVDVQEVVRQTIHEIGYTDPALQFDARLVRRAHRDPRAEPDIAQGVDEGAGVHKDQGAGDQGMMFGYASRETEPATCRSRSRPRTASCGSWPRSAKTGGHMPYLRPDAKSQVTVEYEDDRRTIKRVHTVVVSTQHHPDATLEADRGRPPRARPPAGLRELGAADNSTSTTSSSTSTRRAASSSAGRTATPG